MVGSRIGFPQEGAPRAAAVLQPLPQLGLQQQVPVYHQHQCRAHQQQRSIPVRKQDPGYTRGFKVRGFMRL